MRALSLLFLTATAVFGSATRMVTVIYTNDLHGELLPVPDWTVPGDPKPVLGGFDRLSAMIRMERAKGGCLVVDGGDFMRGSPEVNRSKGMLMVDAMSRAGYDAVCAGERDITWLVELIDTVAQRARFRVLGDQRLGAGATVDMVVVRPSLVREVDGIRVGLIGLLDDRLITRENADSNLYSSGVPPELTLDREVKALRSQDAEVIVVLAHMPVERVRKLARQFPQVTAFICGHEGLVFEAGTAPSESLPLIAEAGVRGERVGVCRILVDSALGKVIETRNRISNLMPQTVQPDSESANWLMSRIDRKLDDSLGFSMTELAPDISGSSPLGLFVAEQVRRQASAEIVILPFSVLDWALVRGVATRRSLSRVVPYDDALVLAKLDDVELAQVLTEAVQNRAHRPAVVGASYDVVRADSLHPGLGDRAINVKPTKFTPRHDVVLARSLAISAGLPAKAYRPVKGTLTELFVNGVAALPIFPPNALQGRQMGKTSDFGPSGAEASKLVNINTATSEELQTLPGIGPVYARRIIEYRQARPFQKLEDMMKVKGIGKTRFGKIKDKITL